MVLAYNILYTVVFFCALPFFAAKILLGRKYRRSLAQRLGVSPPPASVQAAGRPIWIHALSVGETRSAIPLVKRLREVHPETPIVFSTSTETGQDTAIRELGGLVQSIFYAPLDFYPAVARCVDGVNPRLFVLVETDIWPNLLWLLRRKSVPAILVNGRMSESSFRTYRAFRFFMKRILALFSWIGMQAPVYAERMMEMGAPAERVAVGGNLKCDQDLVTLNDAERNDLIRSLGWDPQSTRILVAGSTHEGEEEAIFKAFSQLAETRPGLALIAAPRKPERAEKVCGLGAGLGLGCIKRSEAGGQGGGRRVVVVDSMGELSRLYGLGEAAFVGGSLAAEGGHNPLEPAAHKKPVLFGPHMEDFPEVARFLLESGGAATVRDENDLLRAWKDMLDNPGRAENMGQKAYDAWRTSRGSVQTYVSMVERFL